MKMFSFIVTFLASMYIHTMDIFFENWDKGHEQPIVFDTIPVKSPEKIIKEEYLQGIQEFYKQKFPEAFKHYLAVFDTAHNKQVYPSVYWSTCAHLAECYTYGLGLPVNRGEAIKLLTHVRHGQNVPDDLRAEAQKNWELLSKIEHNEDIIRYGKIHKQFDVEYYKAVAHVAECHAYGHGMPRDEATAKKYFEEIAKQKLDSSVRLIAAVHIAKYKVELLMDIIKPDLKSGDPVNDENNSSVANTNPALSTMDTNWQQLHRSIPILENYTKQKVNPAMRVLAKALLVSILSRMGLSEKAQYYFDACAHEHITPAAEEYLADYAIDLIDRRHEAILCLPNDSTRQHYAAVMNYIVNPALHDTGVNRQMGVLLGFGMQHMENLKDSPRDFPRAMGYLRKALELASNHRLDEYGVPVARQAKEYLHYCHRLQAKKINSLNFKTIWHDDATAHDQCHSFLASEINSDKLRRWHDDIEA